MLLLTIEVTDQHAMKTLHSLKEKRLIKIAGGIDLSASPSLPGVPSSLQASKNRVADAEKATTVSLNQAKTQWARKRKQLAKDFC